MFMSQVSFNLQLIKYERKYDLTEMQVCLSC